MQSDLIVCSFHTGGNSCEKRNVAGDCDRTSDKKKNTGLLIAEEGVNGKRKDQFFGVTQKC